MSKKWQKVRKRIVDLGRSFYPQRIKGRFNGPCVLANSIPKSGTNLLKNCLYHFPSLRPAHKHSSLKRYRHIGSKELKNTLKHIRRGHYFTGHVPYTESNGKILKDNNIRSIMIIRDPRDVVVSHMHWATEKKKNHRLRMFYQSLPSDYERLMASLKGFSGEHTADGKPFEGVKTWFKDFMPWRKKPYNLTIKFEDLVGHRGGGDDKRQLETIKKIAKHLEIEINSDTLRYIGDNTFSSDTHTFRKGKIGGWKDHFDERCKEECKKTIGEWIIELGYEKNNSW
jgi:hypothetical protein